MKLFLFFVVIAFLVSIANGQDQSELLNLLRSESGIALIALAVVIVGTVICIWLCMCICFCEIARSNRAEERSEQEREEDRELSLRNMMNEASRRRRLEQVRQESTLLQQQFDIERNIREQRQQPSAQPRSQMVRMLSTLQSIQEDLPYQAYNDSDEDSSIGSLVDITNIPQIPLIRQESRVYISPIPPSDPPAYSQIDTHSRPWNPSS